MTTAIPSERILSFEEYGRIRHSTPYVVALGDRGSRLILFGVQHTSDPRDPMFDQIEALFLRQAPRFALHEGTPPALEADREVAIRRHGEAGLVHLLAARVGITADSMDIALADEARELRRHLPLAEALTFLVVRQLASFNRKTARMDFDLYFHEFFELIEPALGLREIDWPLVDEHHRAVMGEPIEPRAVTAQQTNPMRSDLPTQRIARLSNRLRDEHMLARLAQSMEQHGRVFATVGVSHAVMLEPALRATDLR